MLKYHLVLTLKYHLVFIFLYICLLLLMLLTRHLTKCVYSVHPAVLDYSPVFALLILPWTFLYGGYIYDFPELLFFIVCLIFLIKQQWLLYYLSFSMSILNKETGALLLLYFIALKYRTMPNKKFLKHIIAHASIVCGILSFLAVLYARASGTHVIWQAKEHIAFFLSPHSHFMFCDPYCLGIDIFPQGGNIFLLILISFLIFYKWTKKPLPIRYLLILTLIFIIPLFIVFGAGWEIRILGAIFPPLYLLCLHTVHLLYVEKFLASEISIKTKI